MSVVTRFAPSPTGFLHIGGARTALFNYLFAKHHGGQFLLRVEDTDRKRSTEEAMQAILHGMNWLELNWDGAETYQSQNADRHREVAEQLVADGNAYKCYCTPEELAEMREIAKNSGGGTRMYDGRWRDRDASEAPAGIDPVIRIKMPLEGETTIADLVQGDVTKANDTLDDFIILRSDGTPTYMLAVVVDDHDMGVTHAIRGDDHLNNAFRQLHLFKACGWDVPEFAHIPLIHGSDGAKLSKRHGALGVEAYEEMGILPEAMCNYLLRLGWSHGDDETISREQAIEWFNLDAVGRSPARFDMDKLLNLNAQYLKTADADTLAARVLADANAAGITVSPEAETRLVAGMPGLASRAKNTHELFELSHLYLVDAPIEMTEKARDSLTDAEARQTLKELAELLKKATSWGEAELDGIAREYAETRELKLGKVAQPLRAALTGSSVSPSIFEVMAVLGRDETLARLEFAAN
ncbi:MAG: glutamate--tRNA ligase [Rhodospirillaceae bacterium]|jgi:glutamyl-tRNA synthetase|nr:glutamate--tRNA ligase [Rhodospirillaceae bacterium]MBT3929684.1 glutamate--tRNA ligase [Rhodospirillaceae bacterium]MBT4771326.1 glutamate--tRNA ligase [Rhodospirillaceae bacterium]MBT5359164.1 glutamate--tRNA ligase [Rhodospirillaceae bacterium]MBT5769034.1 glutamate--tRNA ligase [Rhodospirillaceae bacterium]